MQKILSLLCAFLVSSSLFTSVAEAQTPSDESEIVVRTTARATTEDTLLIDEIRTLLNEVYYIPVPEEALAAQTIPELMKILQVHDPYTTYHTPEENEILKKIASQSFVGIGAKFVTEPEGALITKIYKDSPAQEAGLQIGSIITTVDGHPLAGLSEQEITNRISGEEGSSVELTILQNGLSSVLTVTRKKVTFSNVVGEVLDGHIGYVRIERFGEKTFDDFVQVVSDMAAEQPASFILDLRGNSGGDVYSAIGIAAAFLEEGDLITTFQYRDPDNVEPFIRPAAPPGFPPPISLPVIVLVDNRTASASEIVTSALRDHNRVTILGDKTYGKGVAQAILDLSNGGALRVTDTKIIPPGGQIYDKKGILPDINLQTVAPPSLQDQKDRWNDIARLLFSHLQDPVIHEGDIQFTQGNTTFTLSPKNAQTTQFWRAYRDILATVSPNATIKMKTTTGWRDVTPAEIQEMFPLYFPNYHSEPKPKMTGTLSNGKLNVTLSNEKWVSGKNTVELIQKDTGERVPLLVQALNAESVHITQQEAMKSNVPYWFVIK